MLRMLAAVLALAFVTAAADHAYAAPAKKRRMIVVRSDGALANAVLALRASGGTIVLRPGTYHSIVIGPRSGGRLNIVGSRGTRLGGVLLWRTKRVSIGNLRLGPVGNSDAKIELQWASQIDLHDLFVSARKSNRLATIFVAHARHVMIRDSEFTHCGDFSAEFSKCVMLNRGAHNVTIQDNRFHDCHGCDFIHGRFGSWLTIRRNTFDRALPCHTMSRHRCGHNDLIQLFAGQWLRVERNHFGVYRAGGAQIYLTNDVDHATIVNNVFIGTDPRVPDYRARVAIVIGANESKRMPYYAKVVNNTILTGWLREDGYRGSMRMSSKYGSVKRWKRPIVANNVIGLLETSWRVCAASQRFVRNIVLEGRNCDEGEWVGPDDIDARGRPRIDAAVIDNANRHYAPKIDYTGRRRDSSPDIGAYEFRAAVR